MRKLNLGCIFGLMCLLTGCPYRSDMPADKSPAGIMDPTLLGTWRSCEIGDKKECWNVFVYKLSEAECYVEIREVSDTADKFSLTTTRYRAFPTGIGAPALLNLQELSLSTSSAESNLFIRTELLDPDRLKVSFVSDNFAKEQFNTSRALGEYLKTNMDKPNFIESFAAFTRIK